MYYKAESPVLDRTINKIFPGKVYMLMGSLKWIIGYIFDKFVGYGRIISILSIYKRVIIG